MYMIRSSSTTGQSEKDENATEGIAFVRISSAPASITTDTTTAAANNESDLPKPAANDTNNSPKPPPTPQYKAPIALKKILKDPLPLIKSTTETTTTPLTYSPPSCPAGHKQQAGIFTEEEQEEAFNSDSGNERANSKSRSPQRQHSRHVAFEDLGPDETSGPEEDSQTTLDKLTQPTYSTSNNFFPLCLLVLALLTLLLLVGVELTSRYETDEVYYDPENDKNFVITNHDLKFTMQALAGALTLALLLGSVCYFFGCTSGSEIDEDDEEVMGMEYHRDKEIA